MRASIAPVIVFLLVPLPNCAAQSVPSLDAVKEARELIHEKSTFFFYMNESQLGDDCGGYSEVYRLFIHRTFSESEVIRFGVKNRSHWLTHTIGRYNSTKTTTVNASEETFARFESKLRSTPFLSMDASPEVWGIDTDKYYFEWCAAGNYYAVQRERDDPELGSMFEFLTELVAAE